MGTRVKTLVIGDCNPTGLLREEDPSVPTEDEFTASSLRALTCVFSQYHCVPFTGTFTFDEVRSRPDFALIARDLSHWFVVEVELVSHSLEGHVLPQVRVFRYGDPNPDCCTSIQDALGVAYGQAQTFLQYVPRAVVVVANERRPDWEKALVGLDAQLVTVSMFSGSVVRAVEVDGQLRVPKESVGFGTYFATDRAIRMPASVNLACGEVQVDDPGGFPTIWVCHSDGDSIWLTRKIGDFDLPDRTILQVLRTHANRLFMRVV